METKIMIDNLKCGGCAETITKQLEKLSGIETVTVLPEAGEVDITYNSKADLDSVKQKLKALGYPESGTVHGIEKTSTNIKSYVSCAIGKISAGDKK